MPRSRSRPRSKPKPSSSSGGGGEQPPDEERKSPPADQEDSSLPWHHGAKAAEDQDEEEDWWEDWPYSEEEDEEEEAVSPSDDEDQQNERKEFVQAFKQLGDRVEKASIIQSTTVKEKDKIEGMPDLPESRDVIAATSSVPDKARIWLKDCDTEPEDKLQDPGAFPNLDQKMNVLLMAKMGAKGGIW